MTVQKQKPYGAKHNDTEENPMAATATSKARPKAREGEEIWETTTDGVVWIPTVDVRGRERSQKIGGSAGSILRITTIDREVAQDRARPFGTDPFVNGMLRRVDADQNVDPKTASLHAITTEDLITIFQKNGNAFRAAVNDLNEHNTRRLLQATELVDATVAQVNYLTERVKSYRPEGDPGDSYSDLRRDLA